jgi:uncharacterized protein (DUF1778 family)
LWKNIRPFGWQDTEKCDTFFLTIEGQALDPRPAVAITIIVGEIPMKAVGSASPKRKDRVAHIRLSAIERDALDQAAAAADMTVSAFVRSLCLEGAGVCPFLSDRDRVILDLLANGLRTIAANLKRIARAINTGRIPVEDHLAGSVKDAHVVATTIAAELADMTRRSASARRGEGA